MTTPRTVGRDKPNREFFSRLTSSLVCLLNAGTIRDSSTLPEGLETENVLSLESLCKEAENKDLSGKVVVVVVVAGKVVVRVVVVLSLYNDLSVFV